MNKKLLLRVMTLVLALSLIAAAHPPGAHIAQAAAAVTLGNGSAYYVSNSGNDANSGLSPAQAWKSLEKINATNFLAGDSILFERGGVWNGTLYPKGSGLPGEGNSIYVDAYGDGAAPLIMGPGSINGRNGNSPESAAVYLYNQQYWEIRSLELTNWDPGDIDESPTSRSYNQPAQRLRRGVYIYVDENATGYTLETEGYVGNPGRVLSHIVIEDLYIHDVKGDDRFSGDGKGTGGIYVHIAGNVKTKIDDLQILNNRIEDIGRSGISLLSNWQTGSNPFLSNRCYMTNVTVSGNVIRRSGGDGLIVIGLKDAVLEYNTIADANYSGPRHQMDSGPAYLGAWAVGMFPFFTDGTTIQYNEVYNTRTMDDGQAIDVDGQNNGTIVQYNYTHDNEGGAYLVMVDSYSNSRTFNTVIRYNISQNDNRTIFSIQSINNLLIYNNTVFVGKDMQTRIVGFSSQTANNTTYWARNVEFTNNLFMFFGKRANDANVNNITNLSFRNNWYYGDWAPLKSEEGYETRRGDPGLVDINSLPDYWTVYAQQEVANLRERSEILERFRLRDDSPLIDAGAAPLVLRDEDRVALLDIAITNTVNIETCDAIYNRRVSLDYSGLTDFYGNDALFGDAPDIGANEYQGARVYKPANGAAFSYGAEAYKDRAPSSLTGTNGMYAEERGSEGGTSPYAGEGMLKAGIENGGEGEIILFDFDEPFQINSGAHLSFRAISDNPGDYVLTVSANMTDGFKTEAVLSGWSGSWTAVSANFNGAGSVSSITVKLSGTGGPFICYIDDIRVTEASIVPAAPEARNVAIDTDIGGYAGAGYPATGLYDYYDMNGDEESGSVYQWFISEDGNSFNLITGAVSKEFVPSGDMIGKFIKFGVKPANIYEIGEDAEMSLSQAGEVHGFTGTSGFEANEFPAMSMDKHTALREPLDYRLADFQSIMNIRNGISADIVHNGGYSYKISGLTNLQYGYFNDIIMVSPLFKTNYLITETTKLSYWMNAGNEASARSGLDFTYGNSGAAMRNNAAIKDMAGAPGAPKDAHGGIPTGIWVNVILDLSPLAGQTISDLFITANPAGFYGTPIEAYFDDIRFIEGSDLDASPPTASGLTISGSIKLGNILTAGYVFRSAVGEPEGDTAIMWQRSDNYDGPFTDIPEATDRNYILIGEDEGKYIRIAVTPKTATASGETVYSEPVGPVTAIPEDDKAPVAYGLSITPKDLGYQINGTTTRGQLTGNYIYYDADGDPETGTSFRWLISDTRKGEYQPIPGADTARFPVEAAFIGKYIRFEVVPVNENAIGKQALSPAILISFYLFEAENMDLDDNFIRNTVAGASGAASNNVIRIDSNKPVGTVGVAYQKLDDIVENYYDVTVYYYDENDGNSPYNVYLNDTLIASWVANANFGTGDPIEQSRTYYTVGSIWLTPDDIIKIEGRATDTSGGEWCRTDCFVLTPTATDEPEIYNVAVDPAEAIEGEYVVLTITAEGVELEGKILTAYLIADDEVIYSEQMSFDHGVWLAYITLENAPPYGPEYKVAVEVDGFGDARGEAAFNVTKIPERILVGVTPSAYVTKLNGSENDLTITIVEMYSDDTVVIITETFRINNNSTGAYAVGAYNVYVDTKGNTQIRECYIL